jgi:hypothetical protein
MFQRDSSLRLIFIDNAIKIADLYMFIYCYHDIIANDKKS